MTAPAPTTVTSSWKSGVYPGDGINAAAAQHFGTYRGRAVSVAIIYPERDTWAEIATNTWEVDQYRGWSGQLSIGLALLPNQNAGTLAQVAAGAHDADFRQFAQNLVQAGRGASIIRLGWEFNGNWFPWSAYDAASYVAAFRRVAGILRSVDPQVTIEWCGNAIDNQAGHDPFTTLYPGDDVVNIVGVDAYDNAWADISGAASFQAWASKSFGLNAWYAFARAHGKPFSVSEWGLVASGQGDNPSYIQGMHNWFVANAGGMAYESYFEDSEASMQDVLDHGNDPTSAALYAKLWASAG